MPRAAKPKVAAAKKAKSKLYAMPEKIKEGTILTDLAKGQWRIGASIGVGGFGEIYAASRKGDKQTDAVVKCEPHGNGPLFVEMHFYLRNAKLDDIKQFKQKHRLKNLGMPHILAHGSEDINGLKHRFIVMPRYGTDIFKLMQLNGNRLPEATVYRLALQMLDVFEFIHGTGYVHADLKAANILMGVGKDEGASQAYLVDFGLASHFATGDFKPDPKKMHNGTIEYTSRDAHQGVATRRSDLEILGYNLIQWLGVELPWIKEKLLAVPLKVQKAKEAFMLDVNAALEPLFSQGAPACVVEYMKYVSKLGHNEEPDYDKCRSFFNQALKQMNVTNSGALQFKLQKSSSNNNNTPQAKKAAGRGKAKQKVEAEEILNSSNDVIPDTDEEKEDVAYTPRRKLAAAKASPPLRRPKVEKVTPVAKSTSVSPKKRVAPPSKSPQRGPSPQKRAKLGSNDTPKAAEAKLNFSPAISLRGRAGKTVINDDLTPQPRSKKTYEFNFELDVSMDANVIVNVKRKRKGKTQTESSPSKSARTPTTLSSVQVNNIKSSPATRVNLRKVDSGNSANSPTTRSSERSPRTPAVTVRKIRH